MYGFCEEVNDEDREAPSTIYVYKEDRKGEDVGAFVENVHKRIVKHYDAKNEEY
jgi:hypothetical protein